MLTVLYKSAVTYIVTLQLPVFSFDKVFKFMFILTKECFFILEIISQLYVNINYYVLYISLSHKTSDCQ